MRSSTDPDVPGFLGPQPVVVVGVVAEGVFCPSGIYCAPRCASGRSAQSALIHGFIFQQGHRVRVLEVGHYHLLQFDEAVLQLLEVARDLWGDPAKGTPSHVRKTCCIHSHGFTCLLKERAKGARFRCAGLIILPRQGQGVHDKLNLLAPPPVSVARSSWRFITAPPNEHRSHGCPVSVSVVGGVPHPLHIPDEGLEQCGGCAFDAPRGCRDRTCSRQSKAWSLTLRRSYFPAAVVLSGHTAFSSS